MESSAVLVENSVLSSHEKIDEIYDSYNLSRDVKIRKSVIIKERHDQKISAIAGIAFLALAITSEIVAS